MPTEASQALKEKHRSYTPTRNICIVQVSAVEIIEKIHEATEGEDEEIELLHQLPLSGSPITPTEILNKLGHHTGESTMSSSRTLSCTWVVELSPVLGPALYFSWGKLGP